MQDITAIILTRNEEKNLPDCLRSLEGFARRVIVVDSESEDRTAEIARAAGAEVLVHPFEYHARQFNWALDSTGIETRWILHIDADERLTPELREELAQLMRAHADDDVNGIAMRAWLYFLGRKLKHGGNMKHKLMVFKTGKGRLEDRRVDEHLLLSEGRSVEAKNRFLHYDFRDMTHFVAKMNWYASREAQDYFDAMKDGGDVEISSREIRKLRRRKFGLYYRMPMFLRCWMVFVYFYIFKLGFLDGREGFLYHFLYSRWYRTLVDAKIYEHQKTQAAFEDLGALRE